MSPRSLSWPGAGLALFLFAFPAAAQTGAHKLVPTRPDATADLIEFRYALTPPEARRGETVRLTITGTPRTGYHTYPVTRRSADPFQDPSGLTRLTFTPPPGIQVLEPMPAAESEPEWVVESIGATLLEFRKPFTWEIDLLVLPDAPVGEISLPLAIRLQACDERGCTQGRPRFDIPIRVGDAPAVPLTPQLQARLKAPRPEIKVVPVPADAGSVEPPAVAEAGFFKQLFLAMGAGFIMLFTPCVFPMIPVTVSFFLKQGEKQHNSPLVLATVYTGTIVAVLTIVVLVLGNVIFALANNVWLNLAMGLLLVFFALSLFGMFELELPHFLTRFTSAREGTGYVGAFFMALTFAVNSFTCTGPFLGPLLSAVKELKMSPAQLFANAVAYSAAFAAPFFVLALFPRLLKSLPKGGGWLNAVKVGMGFLELALAMKFFSIMDAGLSPGDPRLFNYETVLCTWIALAVACGLYLFGTFRLPHDTPLEHIGVPRLLTATLCLGLAVYMTPLLWRRVPLGTVGEFLVAWLPQDSGPVTEGWSRDYEKAWAQARAEKKLLFIDFTGLNCINCRFNEQTVFPRPDVRAEIDRFVRVRLYTDLVPGLPRDLSLEEAERNLKWQENTFNDIALPLYVVLDPAGDGKPVTPDGKLAGVVKGKASGTINDVRGFVDMLRKAAMTEVAVRP